MVHCPQCGARTEVTETRGSFRDRRCTNPVCRMEFTTREQILTRRERTRLCARTRATLLAEQREGQPAVQAISAGPTDRQSGDGVMENR